MKFLNVVFKDSWTKKLGDIVDKIFPRPEPKLVPIPVRVPPRRQPRR